MQGDARTHACMQAVHVCMLVSTWPPLPLLRAPANQPWTWRHPAGLPVIPCPRCHRVVERPVLASLFPDTLLALEDTLTNAWLQAQGVMR